MNHHNGKDEIVDDLYDEVLHAELTEEAYEELSASEGSAVVGLSFWEGSVADELEEEPVSPQERTVLDLDLYLDDNTLLELYGASLFTSEGSDPVTGMPALEKALVDLADNESQLSEIAETEDGALALVFTAADRMQLIVSASAWVVAEWEELPEE